VDSASTRASAEELAKVLTGKQWFWHWENRNRDRPFRYLPDGKISGGKGASSMWSLEKRIVLKHSDHYLILIDNQRLRGFRIPTGKSVGAFCD
jgi:hypothetical protein